MFEYLTKEDIIELHGISIQQDGGSAGILNPGAIAYAADAPMMDMYGKELYPTIVDKAAILCYTLVTRHAFVDGNERIGAFALLTFLDMNGYELKDTIDSMEEFVLDIAKGDMSLDDIKAYIELGLVKSHDAETITESQTSPSAALFPLLSLLGRIY